LHWPAADKDYWNSYIFLLGLNGAAGENSQPAHSGTISNFALQKSYILNQKTKKT